MNNFKTFIVLIFYSQIRTVAGTEQTLSAGVTLISATFDAPVTKTTL